MVDAVISHETKARITVLCSGNGSNLQAILDACADGRLAHATVVRVVTNRRAAFATRRAEQAGVPAEYFNLVKDGFQAAGEKDQGKLAEARKRYDEALGPKVLADRPDLVVLAGWMHVFSSAFLRHLDRAGVPVINLHPALPGNYDGANAIKRAYDDFQAGKLEQGRTGVMMHYCVAEVDRGEPILVQEIECREGETLEQLEDRMHEIEHVLIVKATDLVAQKVLDKKTRT